MFFNGPLFQWQFRQVRWVTLIALVVALGYTLFEPELLYHRSLGLPLLFVFVHSILITWRLGRARSREFGFLYSQGYSRDAIWWHMMLASAASVITVWLPVALIIWSGLRCSLQDAMLNYRFPFMGPLEMTYLLWPLLLYFLFVPTFHYAWIRNLQPTRGPVAGFFVAVAMVMTVFTLWSSLDNMFQLSGIALWLILGGLIMASGSLLLGSWRLHRRLEVAS